MIEEVDEENQLSDRLENQQKIKSSKGRKEEMYLEELYEQQLQEEEEELNNKQESQTESLNDVVIEIDKNSSV